MSVLHQFVQEVEIDAETLVTFREAKAIRIRELANKWADNTLQLGYELKDVRDSFPIISGMGANFSRPGWAQWVADRVGFSESYASKLIRVAEVFPDRNAVPNGVTVRVLEVLSYKTVPETARAEVLQRIEAGETIGRQKAKSIIDEHRPSASEARQIARETGQPTAARDGKIYLGATKEQEQEAEDRRTIVYGVRRAVDTLAEMQMSGAEFITYAFKHQLWKVEEEHVITEAYEWLTDLVAAWEKR